MSGRKRGPAPKPAELRRLEAATGGTLNHTSVPDIVTPGGRPLEPPAAPASLRDVYALELWNAVSRALHELGVLANLDLPVLAAMCTQYARMRRAQDVLELEGLFARGSTGQITQHPALKIEREATRLFHVLASEYALTPSARTRLGLDLLLGARIQRTLQEDDDLGPNPRRLAG